MGKIARAIGLAELPDRELASIFRQGALLRLPYLESRVLQARERIKHFEEKYGTTLDVLAFRGLSDDANYEMHEDFIEWGYWNDVLPKAEVTAGNVRLVLEKVENFSHHKHLGAQANRVASYQVCLEDVMAVLEQERNGVINESW